MLEYIYEWIENVAFYLVILSALLQMVPAESYKKYIRFFAGLILILMLTRPILQVLGMSDFAVEEYRRQWENMEHEIGTW